MSLMTVLSTAVSGLRATQTGMNVVAQNVANADSAGYTRRRMTPIEQVAGDRSAGVRSGDIQRVFDRTVQRQLWQENSGAGYTDLKSRMTSALETIYGPPGSSTALDTLMNGFSSAVDRLVDDPGNATMQSGVIEAGRTLASRLNSLSDGVQALRTEAEGRIDTMVDQANTLLQGIERVNSTIVSSGSSAALEDERDRLVGELSRLIDVRAVPTSDGRVTVLTGSGQTLFDGSKAMTLRFDARSLLTAGNSYDTTPPSVGVLELVSPSGGVTDLVAAGAIRSGAIYGALEMRDEVLVQAQTQLDEIAAGLTRAMSGTPSTVTGAAPAFTVGTMPGAGEAISIAFTVGGEYVRLGGTVAEVNTALGAYGGSLGGGGALNLPGGVVHEASILATGTAGTGGLAFFNDRAGNAAFTGNAGRTLGYASRIQVNGAVTSNPAVLVNSTLTGDPARATAIRDGLARSQTFAAQAGLSGNAPFTGDILTATRRTVEVQGAQAASAARLDEGQQVALRSIEARFAADAGVDIDQEMQQLIQLQTAYGANARVMQAAREMFDTLLRI